MTMSDFRAALRGLAKDRGFTVTAVLAIALAIGANNTIFTLGNGIFLRDLPFADADRVVAITTIIATNKENQFDNMSLPDLRDLQAGSRLFTAIAGVDEVPMNVVETGRAAERVAGAYVTANAFSLLGVRPALGRDLTAADEREGAEPVVILGASVWRSRYNSDPAVLGRALTVDAVTATIVGVMPDGFGFPTSADLWLPITARGGASLVNRGERFIDGVGRLAPGVTREQALAELTGLMHGLAAAHPDTNADVGPRIRPFRDTNTSGVLRVTFGGLTVAVLLLLLVACANVANLLLARGAVRGREISLRLSLGATRLRIIGQLLIESLLLAAIGAAIGVLLSAGAVRAVREAIRGTGEPYWLAFPLDGRVLAFAIGITVATALLFGLLPAFKTTKRGLLEALAGDGYNVAGRPGSRRSMGGLVIVQVALTLTLLAGAGLIMRSTQVQFRIDAGVDTGRLISMRLDLPARTYPDAAARARFYQQLDQQLASLPGIAAGSGSWAPLGGAFERRVSFDDGRPVPEPGQRPETSSLMIGPGYFDAIGVRATRGRLLTAADSAGTPVAIVNQQFAARFFGRREALGRRIALDANGPAVSATDWVTIVGVVPNVRHEESDARIVEPVVYLPHAAAPLAFLRIVAQAPGDAAPVVAGVRAAVDRIDSALPFYQVGRVRDALALDLWPFQVFGTMFVVFASIGLLLAAVGLYGMTAYSVAVRKRELGVRMALGAEVRHIAWTVTRRAAGQVGIGLAIGGVGAALAGNAIAGVLFSISPFDPTTLIAVTLVCLGATLLACAGPAWRAIRTNPVEALRQS